MTTTTPPQDEDLILSIEGLSTTFRTLTGPVTAVQDATLELRRGQTLAIVGESGSGKSVTTRSMMGILDPGGEVQSGKAFFSPDPGDTPVDLLSLDPGSAQFRDIRGRKIGMIFQEPMASLSPMQTIGAHIVEVLRIHQGMEKKQARQRGIELLEQVGIRDPEACMDSYSFQLSGGMCQRAMIALALSCEPRLLIADEPTTALDVTTQARVLDLIEQLKRDEHLSVLFITHDLGVVARVADHVAVMNQGVIVEQGPVDRIFEDPKDPYTQKLLAASRPAPRLRVHEAGTAPSETKVPLIEIKDLEVTFTSGTGIFTRQKRTVNAVQGVSMNIYPGETLGLVGESGSGKTTTGRCVVKAQKPTAGTLSYVDRDGEPHDLSELTPAQVRTYRTDVRMVFQDPYTSLNPRMRLFDILAEPLRINNLASGSALRDRVAAELERVGLLPDHMNRYPHAFSGGQRQRVNIARALITDPRVVVADEAVSALDVSVRAQILELLAGLQDELGLTYLFISHDLSVVESICDRVAVMQHGRLVEMADTPTLFDDPQDEYTRTMLDAVPVPDPRLYQGKSA